MWHLRSLGVEFVLGAQVHGIRYSGGHVTQFLRDCGDGGPGTATPRSPLRDEDRLGWFVDPAVTGLGGPAPRNREQLLIHPTGTLDKRPTVRTAVPAHYQRAAGRGQFGRRTEINP